MKFNDQLNRMKGLMNYGLQTESKAQYKSIEYMKEGADGKTYGIIREGAKFYIKVADKTKNVLKEDFNYIGGFMNRGNYEYNSYANALKNFDMKMSSLNESMGDKKIMVESWNPEKKEVVLAEASDKMKAEIARQRQIMGNAALIAEKKNYSANLTECDGKSCCPKTGEKVNKEYAGTQKDNIKNEKPETGDPKKNGGDPFTEKPKFDDVLGESEEVLGWNENPDYLDTSKGTEIGDTAPFDKPLHSETDAENGVIEEGESMHDKDNQNTPTPGTGEIGDDAPFDGEKGKQIDEGFEDDAEDVELDADEDLEGDEFGDEDADFDSEEDFVGDEEFADDADLEGEELAGEEDFGESDIEARLSSLEELIGKIADKLGVGEFDDDELYDDEPVEGEEDVDYDVEFDDEEGDEFGDEEDVDFEDDEEEFDGMESKRAKGNKINEDKLDYFGKHPAYRKQPMKVPSNKHQEMPDYYDMNDETVNNEQPYGQKIGSSAPFEIDPKAIDNAIAESIQRIFGSKKV